MKISPKVIGLSLLCFANTAMAQSAKERSPLWICRSAEGYSCEEGKGCTFIPASLLKLIDFNKMVVKEVGWGMETKITDISYQAPGVSKKGETFIRVGQFQTYVLSSSPGEAPFKDSSFAFRMITLSIDSSQRLYFGTCSPEG